MNNKFIKSFLFVVLTVVMVFALSCSTKKNTFTRRVYHNLTAHYNAYFNGKEALKEGRQELSKKQKDNYYNVLPVFELGTKSDAQSVYNFMDRAIEKGSKVIQKHSIFVKGEEHIKWIDDAFLLIGKSYFFKQEYDMAFQTFDHILTKYKGTNSRYEAIIWKAMVLTQKDRLEEAEAVLLSIEKKIEKNKASRAAQKLYPLAFADLLVKQQRYGDAIDYLKEGISLNKSKRIRTRLTFILAQVYQKNGNPDMANKYYRKVLGMNPIYDMEFATKINMAKNYEVTLGSSTEIKKILAKMLRDQKNIDYYDQIHYALAEIYLKENDKERAINHLKKSAQKSVSNDFQKSISYLKLGDLYFADADYTNAQVFYDSCLMVLPKNFPNYANIEYKTATLNDLVKNLNTVKLEDSLQMLSKLTPAEREQKIQEEINAILKEEARIKQEELNNASKPQDYQTVQQLNSGANGWYFYNNSSLSFGYNEFMKKWGKRKYEDLWRLSNKIATEVTFDDNGDEADSTENPEDAKTTDNKDPKAYLAKIPLTEEAIAKSNLKISEALFNVGVIYKEALGEPEKAIEYFTKLVTRFPDSKQTPAAYYNLYQIYVDAKNADKAQSVKSTLIQKFPDSDFALYLQDPNYAKTIEERNNRLSVIYKNAYQDYLSGNYTKVISVADSVLGNKADKNFTPKFDFLKAMSIGKSKGKNDFIEALKTVSTKYKDTEVQAEAKKMLAFFEAKTSDSTSSDGLNSGAVKSGAALYTYDPNDFHFYIVVFDIKNIKTHELKNQFSNNNSKYFSTKGLVINTLYLNDQQQILNVGRFDNMPDALLYMGSVENNPGIMNMLGNVSFFHFVISAKNYPVFFKTKNLAEYLQFYEENYNKQ